MFGAILKATNCSFQKGMTFCRSKYVKKVMKLLAFIFEQPSYMWQFVPAIGQHKLTSWQQYVFCFVTFPNVFWSTSESRVRLAP